MRAVIIGASGGIGAALTKQLAARAECERVYALSRTLVPETHKIQALRIDLEQEDTIHAAAEAINQDGAPDLVIVATGMLSEDAGISPEKSYRQQTPDAFAKIFNVNTIGPALIAKHFLPIMPRKQRAVFAALSARVGSISDNRIGGWHAYRASKAALNMLIKNYAIEQARRNDAFIAVGLHPGTVHTDLSKPFQSGVPDKQLFTAEQSARYLLGVIANLAPSDSGKVFDWAGKEVPA